MGKQKSPLENAIWQLYTENPKVRRSRWLSALSGLMMGVPAGTMFGQFQDGNREPLFYVIAGLIVLAGALVFSIAQVVRKKGGQEVRAILNAAMERAVRQTQLRPPEAG